MSEGGAPGWRDAECNFRRWALCATRPSCVPKRTECNLRGWALCATRPSCVPKRTKQSGSPCTCLACMSPLLLVSTDFFSGSAMMGVLCGLRPRTMVGSAPCVKLAHIHHCAWLSPTLRESSDLPATCYEAPFAGPFSGYQQTSSYTCVVLCSTITTNS